MELTDIRVIRDVMNRFGKKFAKSLGQNFLTSAETIENIVEQSDIDEDTVVLEIGPGIGVLTQSLAARAKKVVSVEIDKNLLPVLDYTLGECDNVTIINEDIMKTDIPALCEKYFDGKKAKVVANLPYYITTHIIMKLMEYKECFSSITVMVQKEVAERMSAKEGKKDFGAFTVAVQYHCKAEILMTVPPEYFVPAPKVSSAVIRLDILDKPSVDTDDEKLFFKVVRASFANRRKTLVNSLSGANIGFGKEQIAKALDFLGLKADIRAEKLSLSDFAKLTDYLNKNK